MASYITQKVNDSNPTHVYTSKGKIKYTVGVDSDSYKIRAGEASDVKNVCLEITPEHVKVEKPLIVNNIKTGSVIAKNMEVDSMSVRSVVARSIEARSIEAGSVDVSGSVDVKGNFTVQGIATFLNTEVIAVDNLCIQLAINDPVTVTSLEHLRRSRKSSSENLFLEVTTEFDHNRLEGDYILLQGMGVPPEVKKISNVTGTTFDILATEGVKYLSADLNGLVGKINTEVCIDGGGIKLEARTVDAEGSVGGSVLATKQFVYKNKKEAWESNLNIDLLNKESSFSIDGIPKITNTSVGTINHNFSCVYTQGIKSFKGLTISSKENTLFNSKGDISFQVEEISALHIDSQTGNISMGKGGGGPKLDVEGGPKLDVEGGPKLDVGGGPKLDVGGDIQCIDLTTISDERYKNIVDLIPKYYDLDELFSQDGLRGVVFKWNKVEGKTWDTKKYNLGVIAQEIEELVPELVKTDEHGYKSVNYEKMSCIFIEQHKKAQQEIKDLRESVAEILDKLNSLRL